MHVGWRSLFWTAAGIGVFGGCLCALLPESRILVKTRLAAESHAVISEAQKMRLLLRGTSAMPKKHWALCMYAVLLTGFNFLSHGSQDLYPTHTQKTKGPTRTRRTIIWNWGVISSGAFSGWISQFLGRRNTIVAFTLLTAVFILSSFSGLARRARSVQFGVQGAWGIIPIHLAEMAPPAFHATFPGVTYQLASMVSSASAQIKATGGEHLKTTIKDMVVPDYANVQGVFIGVVAVFVPFITIIRPEGTTARASRGTDAGRRIDRRQPRAPRDGALGARSAGENEKASEERSSTEKPAAAPTTATAA
ncbi:major facilitator superfamily domain-containing protein [Mycena albidolilacea]|uniref:Major facilitator superfamily domain-containing protein n=1 Tax=Mycena albidolilacea TaxID=1033008 RepID=A0AAD6ZGP1_9AGAR|nr:major facilitator superfamily domain-containing protein [Mycena albidolilacea]